MHISLALYPFLASTGSSIRLPKIKLKWPDEGRIALPAGIDKATYNEDLEVRRQDMDVKSRGPGKEA